MTSKMTKLLALCLFCVAALYSNHAYCQSNAPRMEKIFIQPSQLHIAPEGIFFINEVGNLENTCGVFHDGDNLYVIAGRYQCPACGRMNPDNICGNKNCSMYGK